MSEGTTIETNMPRIEVPLRESWLKGYISGNAHVPQTGVGIYISTLEAVLNDPPNDWNEFGESQFSDQQVDYLGQVMNFMHAKAGVNSVTAEYAKEDSKIVTDERIQKLWTSTKVDTIKNLGRLIEISDHKKPGDDPSKTRADLTRIADIQAYFDDPANADRINRFKAFTIRAKQLLFNEEVKDAIQKNKVQVVEDPKALEHPAAEELRIYLFSKLAKEYPDLYENGWLIL